jgi:hypothetical protein
MRRLLPFLLLIAACAAAQAPGQGDLYQIVIDRSKYMPAEILATPDQGDLYQIAIDQDKLAGAPDFSFLNHPLTAADRLFARDGHFYGLGKDGKPNTADDQRVRLFGVNLAFGANFPEPADAGRIAKRLRRLGVNLVRLHHMDSNPDRDPQTANSTLTQGPYPTLNPVSVARLRGFLDALRAEGIYANLNLHVGYRFRPAIDKIPAMPGGAEIPTHSKPLNIFYPRMVELQTEYTRKLINALSLRDDPVLGMVEIDNETSLLQVWQGRGFDETIAGDYRDELQRQWNQFLKARYGTTAALRSAWGTLPEEQSLESGTVALLSRNEKMEEERANDFLLFLADRDAHYLRQMLAAVRETAGPLAPVTGTQMGYGGLLNLDSHQDMDYDDHHFYIDHYNFPHRQWDSRDWRMRDASTVGSGFATFMNIAVARRAGRPYTVSEFNQPWPNRQAAEIDPELAAFGAFQDWDAIVHFAYSHGRNWDDGAPNGFNISGDWTKFPIIGQAAWLFRSGAIRAGRQPLEIPISKDLRLQAGRERRNGNIAAFLNAAAGYDPAVAFVHPVRLVKDLGAPVSRPADRGPASPAAGAPGGAYSKPAIDASGPLRFETGEATVDRDGKLFLVHSPSASGVFGFAGTKKIEAGAAVFELAPSARGFASLLLTTLDGNPLKESAHMLFSTPGLTLRSQPGAQPARPQRVVNYEGSTDWWTLEKDPQYPDKPSGNMGSGNPPVWMERVESYVTLATPARVLTVYPLDGQGGRLTALGAGDVERVKGGFRIHFQAQGQQFSPWYELIAKP